MACLARRCLFSEYVLLCSEEIIMLLTKQQIKELLQRLGELAEQQGYQIELLLMGGAYMVLAYNARPSTHDIDALILSPQETSAVRELVKQVAKEHGISEDWLNDAAKGYLFGRSQGSVILSAPGILVRTPAVTQLLAMKLCAWRDDVDIEDARRLLLELKGGRDQVWKTVEPYLVPGKELKAQFAFIDLWETIHGKN